MAYTVTQLITGAFYSSGIVSREFETVSGSELADGLIWLNELIGKKVVEPDLIPYEGSTTFTAVVGQEDYAIDDLIKVDTLTFLKESVRYPMRFVPRNQYRGSNRVETIESLPYQYFFERNLGGATISIYFLPDQAYTFTITGIFRLSEVSLNQDLELTLDRFYITYLRYALAEKICNEYSLPVPRGVAQELAEYQALINKQSRPLDVSIRKRSTLQKQARLGWAWANLGEGYLP